MKRLLFLILTLLTFALVAAPAVAEHPLVMQLADCQFQRLSTWIAPATADTLWFSASSPRPLMAAASRGSSWFPPVGIPTSTKGNGTLDYDVKHVRTVLLVSKSPFWFAPSWTTAVTKSGEKGIAGAAAAYVTVDSSAAITPAGPTSTRADKYPCRAMISGFPDSLIIKGPASGDSVRVILGY